MINAGIAAKPSISALFDTEHLKTDLKARSVRGGAATFLGQGASFFIRTASTVVLARQLTPADFGLVAMVTVVTEFAALFKDLGLSMATIQKPTITHTQVSVLFWVNVGISALVAVLTMALAPAVAWFYGDPRLTLITVVLAASFVFGGLTVQHQALLTRQMRFLALAGIQTSAILLGVIAAIVAAALGAGYWSLVFMQLVMAFSNMAGAWLLCRWRPGWPVRRSGAREMVAFGAHLTGSGIMNYFARNLGHVLIGRFCGSTTLGLYSKAYGLLLLPIAYIRGPLMAVTIPALSRIQDEAERYRSYYGKMVLLLSFLSMPLVAFLAVCSRSVIHLLLGDQWVEAGRMFQVLALTAFIQPVWSTSGAVMVSVGHSGRFLRFGIINGVVMIASFLIGIHWGALGVAVAYAIGSYATLFPLLSYAFAGSPVSIGTFVKGIERPFVASLAMVVPLVLVQSQLGARSDVVVIGCSLVVGLLGYFGTWLLIPGGASLLREFLSYTSLGVARIK
jgi:O-antigen/teichoic acid export membrane protein